MSSIVDYRSPEHIGGEPVGPPSDVYSLGLVLLDCLSGRGAGSARRDLAQHAQPWRTVLGEMTEPAPRDRPDAVKVLRLLRSIVADENRRVTVGCLGR